MSDIERRIEVYIKIRDTLAAETKVFNERKKNLQDQMDTIARDLLSAAAEQNLDGFKCKGIGTAFKKTKDFISAKDFDTFVTFAIKQALDSISEFSDDQVMAITNAMFIDGPLNYMTRSVTKNSIKAYMEEHEGELPPGINYSTELVMEIRKA